MTQPDPAHVLSSSSCVDRPVQIYRDEWGIPHVRAQSVRDAFAGQGYVHAMDRLWQMDASRTQMQGRWAELVGPSGLEADKLARRLGVSAASQRDYQAMSPGARAMVDSYTAGVNAYLASAQPLPPEYGLLQAAPEPWQGWHCIAAMRQRGYLMGSLWFKLWRAGAVGVIDTEHIDRLRYDDGGADRLCIPPGTDGSRWAASLADLREPIRALAMLPASAEVQGGSNNWAVAPSRTTTGRPLLAGDPHRAFELPGMYAQLHLSCDQFDAIGLTVPGVPGFPHFGHNADVAWCVTHAFADIHDLYVEQFDAADPSRYRYRDQWLTAVTTTEYVAVRGHPDVAVPVCRTIHGPVVAGEPARGAALTLKSVQFFDTDRSFDCLLPMLTARSVDQLFQAVRGWGLIDHNLVAADTSGHIGHLVRAVVPRRPAVNGWLPVPGWTGEYEWDGMVPAEHMPRVDDPGRGFIVTANNRVVADGPGTGDYFCIDAHPPYRARRIEQLLEQLGTASPQDMSVIHRDDLSAPAALFQAALADAGPLSAGAGAIRDVILSWDGRMAPDSRGAACYSRLRWALATIIADRSGLAAASGSAPARLPGAPSAASQLWWVLPGQLRSGDLALTGGQTWPELLAEALEVVAPHGADARWQDIHPAMLVHLLSAAVPGAAAAAGAGLSRTGAGVGGDNETVWANGCRAESGTAAVYGAVARYVFDVGNWDSCSWIVVAGASGDPASPHYADQHEAWSRCQLVPMRYDWNAIAASGTLLTLKPDDKSDTPREPNP
jgi:penicillin G amidase